MYGSEFLEHVLNTDKVNVSGYDFPAYNFEGMLFPVYNERTIDSNLLRKEDAKNFITYFRNGSAVRSNGNSKELPYSQVYEIECWTNSESLSLRLANDIFEKLDGKDYEGESGKIQSRASVSPIRRGRDIDSRLNNPIEVVLYIYPN